MVFAINPPPTGNHSFVNFLANAVANGTVANIPASLTQTGLPPSTISSIPPATATAPSALPPATVTATLTASDGSVGTTTYASYPGQASPTSNPTPVVHNVEVGPGGQLIYSPANITAAIGDIVQFRAFSFLLSSLTRRLTCLICPSRFQSQEPYCHAIYLRRALPPYQRYIRQGWLRFRLYARRSIRHRSTLLQRHCQLYGTYLGVLQTARPYRCLSLWRRHGVLHQCHRERPE